MQLAYAAENLTPIPAEHFLARKTSEPDAIKALLKSDPAAVVRNILESLGGKATLAQISEMLVGDLFTETEWKRWWTSAKKAMKAGGYYSIPTKKSEPIALRSEPVSRADELLTFFNQARQPKEEGAAVDQISALPLKSRVFLSRMVTKQSWFRFWSVPFANIQQRAKYCSGFAGSEQVSQASSLRTY